MLKLFARRKDGNQVLLKMGFLSDPKKKILRMKDEKIGIIWKSEFW